MPNKALLKRVSQSDHQTTHFIIQRSRDNETFFDVREIEGKRESVEDSKNIMALVSTETGLGVRLASLKFLRQMM